MKNPLFFQPMSHRMIAVVLAAFVNVALLAGVNRMAEPEFAQALSAQAHAEASNAHKS